MAPKVGILPATRIVKEAVRSAELAQRTLGEAHGRVRRLAPDDVAEASDVVLEVVAQAASLTSRRRRAEHSWDAVWADAREARIVFERAARADAGQPL